MSATVSYGRDGNIVLICVDNPPVNALSTSVIEGMDLAIDALDKESGCSMAVLYCAGSGFIAGADLKEATTVERSNAAARVINRLAQSGTPVLAAIHGNALGGGLETALACDYRCASADARLGLPEVNIGAVPGYGGTQRLPRLVGLETALRLMTSGASLDAQQALAVRLIDRIITDYSRDAVLAYARELVSSASAVRKTDQMSVMDAGQAKELCEAALAWSAKERPGEEAPALIVRSARMSAMAPIQEGLEYERTISRSRMDADQCLAMRSLFFADRQVRKNAGRAAAAQAAGNRMLQNMFAVIAGLLAGRMDAARVEKAFRGFGWDPGSLAWPGNGTNGARSSEPLAGSPEPVDWDIVHPCLAALEEEGTRALQEFPDLQAGDIDSEFCRTWAFPRYRGGPMYFVTHDRGYSAFRTLVNAAHMTKEVRR